MSDSSDKNNIKLPDFFIVGAPKCGTSALYSYLKEHPDVFMPYLKESHFFGSDLNLICKWLRGVVKDRKEYLSLFEDAQSGQRIGEASVWYLYSKSAAADINAFNPSAKIIISLRNPADMMYSLHNHAVFDGLEDNLDFETALASEQLYWEVPKYVSQITRYIEIFGKENIHVIIYDDFKEKTAEVYHDVLKFLQVNQGVQPEFKIVNARKEARSTTLTKLLNPPPPVRNLIRALFPRRLRHVVSTNLRRINSRPTPTQPMKPELREHINAYFAHEIEDLSRLLNRDLLHWVRN